MPRSGCTVIALTDTICLGRHTFYHDGLVQQGATFDIAWLRCRPKPGSIGVEDASGTYVKEDYFYLAPYCPFGVEIVESAEGEPLEHYPRHFNITWEDTVDPPPPAYGIEIEVWDGDWLPWQQYVHKRSSDRNLFFVPDEFPGDLGGRVRMWGVYGGGTGPRPRRPGEPLSSV